MNLTQYYKQFQSALTAVYSDRESQVISKWVFEHITGKKILLSNQPALNENQKSRLDSILSRLLDNEPVQYVLGETEFYGLKLKVNPAVLIPRPETEELVDWIVKDIEALNHKNPTVLDIGTGSGCIALGIKKSVPEARLTGLDISNKALETARENSRLNGLDIQFEQMDILNPDLTRHTNQYDIIVSNPPYVLEKEKQQMEIRVAGFEPSLALFVPDSDPLLFYRHIVLFAKIHLLAGGRLYFEIHEKAGEDISGLLRQNGFTQIQLKKDMQSKNRMIRAVIAT
jgi:release factor glutamine methyltransferase